MTHTVNSWHSQHEANATSNVYDKFYLRSKCAQTKYTKTVINGKQMQNKT